jgi:hypothetical protein
MDIIFIVTNSKLFVTHLISFLHAAFILSLMKFLPRVYSKILLANMDAVS